MQRFSETNQISPTPPPTSQWPPESKAAGGIVIEKYFTRVPEARHPSNSTQTNIVSAVWSRQCTGNQRAIGTPQKDGMMSSVLPARLCRWGSGRPKKKIRLQAIISLTHSKYQVIKTLKGI